MRWGGGIMCGGGGPWGNIMKGGGIPLFLLFLPENVPCFFEPGGGGAIIIGCGGGPGIIMCGGGIMPGRIPGGGCGPMGGPWPLTGRKWGGGPLKLPFLILGTASPFITKLPSPPPPPSTLSLLLLLRFFFFSFFPAPPPPSLSSAEDFADCCSSSGMGGGGGEDGIIICRGRFRCDNPDAELRNDLSVLP